MQSQCFTDPCIGGDQGLIFIDDESNIQDGTSFIQRRVIDNLVV